MRTGSQLLEHTAEVRLRVRAPTFGELAAEAGRALARLQLGREPPPGEGPWRRLAVRAPDREAVLVDWLNELVFLAEAERWVATEFAVEAATDRELRVRARGVAVDEAPARVKAATFHGLTVASVPGGVEADVVLDV
jgi:SHS2 domain-containing protein